MKLRKEYNFLDNFYQSLFISKLLESGNTVLFNKTSENSQKKFFKKKRDLNLKIKKRQIWKRENGRIKFEKLKKGGIK